MQIDIEVESELYCVLIVVAGANQLIESPAPYHIHLGHFECLELSRSHPFPLARSADLSPCGPDGPQRKSLVRANARPPAHPAPHSRRWRRARTLTTAAGGARREAPDNVVLPAICDVSGVGLGRVGQQPARRTGPYAHRRRAARIACSDSALRRRLRAGRILVGGRMSLGLVLGTLLRPEVHLRSLSSPSARARKRCPSAGVFLTEANASLARAGSRGCLDGRVDE